MASLGNKQKTKTCANERNRLFFAGNTKEALDTLEIVWHHLKLATELSLANQVREKAPCQSLGEKGKARGKLPDKKN